MNLAPMRLRSNAIDMTSSSLFQLIVPIEELYVRGVEHGNRPVHYPLNEQSTSAIAGHMSQDLMPPSSIGVPLGTMRR